jgi:hypothetical protein
MSNPKSSTIIHHFLCHERGWGTIFAMVAEAKIAGDRKVSMMITPGEAIVSDTQGATGRAKGFVWRLSNISWRFIL